MPVPEGSMSQVNERHACTCICIYTRSDIQIGTYVYRAYNVPIYRYEYMYGVATVSRIDKIEGLFCRISSLL